MKKIVKRLEKFCERNENQNNKIKKLTQEFSEKQILEIINSEECCELFFKRMLTKNVTGMWLGRINVFIEIYVKSLFEIKRLKEKKITLEICKNNINFQGIYKLNKYLEDNNRINDGLERYLLELPSFIPNKPQKSLKAEEQHQFVIMGFQQNIQDLIEELEKAEKQRNKINNF